MTFSNDKNKIFIDTNVLIGAFASGKKNEEEKKCWKYVCSLTGKKLFVSSLSVAQFVSVFQRKMEQDDVAKYVRTILSKATIVEFSEKDIEKSLSIEGHDMEDNMQYVLSQKMRCGILITQNKKDYVNYLNVDVIRAKEHRTINQ